MKDPILIKDFLPEYDLRWLQSYCKNLDKNNLSFDHSYKRYYTSSDNVIYQLLINKTLHAREVFESETLLPTYSFFAEYSGNAILGKHKDQSACTYTLDLCLYQTEPWDLWVEGKNYTLLENEVLAYYGEDQEHWREKIPNPESQIVAMIFLHYAEPDHWWFKK